MEYQNITKCQKLQRQLQIRMIKKYLNKYPKKDINLQDKDRKLLIMNLLDNTTN